MTLQIGIFIKKKKKHLLQLFQKGGEVQISSDLHSSLRFSMQNISEIKAINFIHIPLHS